MKSREADPFLKVIFVYNADSGLFNLLADVAHRAFRPRTYPCRLCAVTYTVRGMRSDWRTFVHSLGYPVEFLHRDELLTDYGIGDVPLPAVFINRGDRTRCWISADDIEECRSLDDLKVLVRRRLKELATSRLA